MSNFHINENHGSFYFSTRRTVVLDSVLLSIFIWLIYLSPFYNLCHLFTTFDRYIIYYYCVWSLPLMTFTYVYLSILPVQTSLSPGNLIALSTPVCGLSALWMSCMVRHCLLKDNNLHKAKHLPYRTMLLQPVKIWDSNGIFYPLACLALQYCLLI